MSDPDDILAFEHSLAHVRGNFNELYPPEEGRKKTIANIPTGVHAQLMEICDDRQLKLYEVLAGMLDFIAEYEEIYEEELTEQRKSALKRR